MVVKLERCLYCGHLISTYPCKECGYEPAIPDVCPRFNCGRCMTTKKLCPDKKGYMNCKVFDNE